MFKTRLKKILSMLFIILNYSLRIALAGAVLMLASDALDIMRGFEIKRDWDAHYNFSGSGSYEDPYLITDADDLIKLSDAVNGGDFFNSVYFKQTEDIDMSSCDNFIPIGSFDSGYMFCGIYDGGGHVIRNLNISASDLDIKYAGLFGKLGGTVMNLGILSGRISGDYVGSIAAADGSSDAMIINCYNKANLYAIRRCGGIADNFSSGCILGCANYGHIQGDVTCQIVSYDASLIVGCLNYDESNDYIVPFNTFTGNAVDCFTGNGDITLLNRFIDDYRGFIKSSDDLPVDVIPWS